MNTIKIQSRHKAYLQGLEFLHLESLFFPFIFLIKENLKGFPSIPLSNLFLLKIFSFEKPTLSFYSTIVGFFLCSSKWILHSAECKKKADPISLTAYLLNITKSKK